MNAEMNRERDVRQPLLAQLDGQLGAEDAKHLRDVLAALAAEVQHAVGNSLVGVYLKGSFALGAGDVHADVDFLIATEAALTDEEEARVKELHRHFPDRPEHWAHVLEGSYASLEDLRKRADPTESWLYVDNGNREMEWSPHDNTEVFRWVLKNRALAVMGPDADSLIDAVPVQALREEAAATARRRREAVFADPEYLENAWGQPHEVLMNCRMLYTATKGEVAGKTASAEWCLSVLPSDWHELIQAAIKDRPDPTIRVHQMGDPARAARTREFIEFMTPRIALAADGAAP